MQSLGQAPNATVKEIGKFYLILEDLSQATKKNNDVFLFVWMNILFIIGILLNQKFLAVNYEGAKNLIDTIFSEMDNDVLIDGNMKLIYFVDESVRITKG